VAKMREGAVVALVSDAGTPLVSDPGFVLVQACVAAGLAVEVLPGPSAALAALVASALPADRWRFVGFLPRKKGELQAAFGGPVAVCRELTKLHEEVVRGTAAELAARYAEHPPKGEVALVVGGAPTVVDEIGPALQALQRLVEAGAKPRPAASVVSELTGVPANRLYS